MNKRIMKGQLHILLTVISYFGVVLNHLRLEEAFWNLVAAHLKTNLFPTVHG